jgi:hypothetical protein
MSGKASGRVMEMAVTGARRDVLLAIADCADINGENALCSLDLVAYLSGLTRRWAGETVRGLISDGWLSRTGRGTAGRSIYRLNYEACVFKPAFGEWLKTNRHALHNGKQRHGEVSSPCVDGEVSSPSGGEAQFPRGGEVQSSPHYGCTTVVSTVEEEGRSARPLLSPSPELQQQGSPWRAHPAVRFWHQAFADRQIRLSEAAAKKVALAVGDDDAKLVAWQSAVAIWQQHATWHPEHVDRLLDRMNAILISQARDVGGSASPGEEKRVMQNNLVQMIESGVDVAWAEADARSLGIDWDALIAGRVSLEE